jgi:hypothetical protein
MLSILSPLDQLYQLNREAYVKLDDIEQPLIVVGGQAISYWLDYYGLSEREQVRSVDIDYVAKLSDIRQLNQTWKSLLQEAGNHPPPSLALILLEDNVSHEIKQAEGALFVDIDKYAKNEIKPNLIDFIDRPKGFSSDDMNPEKGLALHTVLFRFPSEYHLEPHQNLKILTPIACLKSRLANHSKPPIKPPQLERIRIRALMSPIIYYIQDQLDEIGFRNLKEQIDLLSALIASPESIRLYVEHDIHLLEILEFFIDNKIEGLPEKFIAQELPRKIKYIENKIQKFAKRLAISSDLGHSR